MPVPMTAQQQADLIDPAIPKDVVWCLSIDTDEGLLAICNRSTPVDYNGVTYERGQDLWKIEGMIGTGTSLIAESLTISFDGALQYDSASLVGRLLDRSWHQRRVELFLLIYNATSGDFIVETRQIIAAADTLNVIDQQGAPSQVVMNCETGTFRAIGRRHTVCSDVDQRRRLATDAFFRNVGVKGSQPLPFGISWSKVPGASGASGGGGNAFGIGAAGVRF